MLKKGQEVSYKQFDSEEQETEPKTSTSRTLLGGALVLAFTILVTTVVYLSISSGYIFAKNFPLKGRVIPRQEWKAADCDQTGEYLSHPVSKVLIQHSQTDPCNTEDDCKNLLRNSQDADPNFYVGGDGNMYEGTGWDVMVEMMNIDMSNSSITITFIGTYITVLPNSDQLQAGRQLLVMGVTTGKISSDYQLLADPQFPDTESPQFSLLNLLNTTHEEPSVMDV